MHFNFNTNMCCMFILGSAIVVVSLIQRSTGIDDVVVRCCGYGKNWASEGLLCSKFQPPVQGVSPEQQAVCLSTVEVCCAREHRLKHCKAGQKAAKDSLDCTHQTRNQSEFYRDCCEACKIGLFVGSTGSGSCKSFFGDPWDSAFEACCDEISLVDLTLPELIPIADTRSQATNTLITDNKKEIHDAQLNQNLCDSYPGELCAHICVPTPGSYRCDCRPGFTLLSDKVSCQQPELPDRCVDNNLCEQKCVDTGVSVECSCHPGYFIMEDKKSCKDVNECEDDVAICEENQVCINRPGGYVCKNIGGHSANKSNDKTSEDHKCPVGYIFNPNSLVCDDVDECALKLVPDTCSDCKNTVGSFVCFEYTYSENCPGGYIMDEVLGKCIDIDECATKTHDCNELSQVCLNTPGKFACQDKASKTSCPPGFKINEQSECEDVNECDGEGLCEIGEICNNLSGGYECTKLPTTKQALPYFYESSSSNHQQLTNNIELKPSTKQQSPTDYQLSEDNHFQSEERSTIDEQPADDDKSKPLQERVANNLQPTYHTEATTTLKPPRLTSVATATTCRSGYQMAPYIGRCVDIDECRLDARTCDSNQYCVNTPGSFTCVCKSGFQLDPLTQACVDVNECQVNQSSCHESQRCDNTIGSYQCIRYTSCGTGYTLNAATGGCEDDDECALGLHDCNILGPQYICRNTQGSFRCEHPRYHHPRPVSGTYHAPVRNVVPSPSPAIERAFVAPTQQTPSPVKTNCALGYELDRGGCSDINECDIRNPCQRNQRCLNTVGSYRCINNVNCPPGFAMNEEGTECADIDECSTGQHECTAGQICLNKVGHYVCKCPPGHIMTADNRCEDVDECNKFSGICPHGECQNTVGAYRCICKPGYRSQEDGKTCVDIDECKETAGLCEHKCTNLWGTFRCTCSPGFKLHANNRSCIDIDECEEFRDRHLCVGICSNQPGSYTCRCPDGYRLGMDARTCNDIDECTTAGTCPRQGDICLNTRGGYHCDTITCPPNYFKDPKHKNLCKKDTQACREGDPSCRGPSTLSYNFITFVSRLAIPPFGYLDLFTMRGPAYGKPTFDFNMELVSVRAGPGVTAARKENFSLRRTSNHEVVISLVQSIEGPQEIQLQVVMDVHHEGRFEGSVAAKLFIIVSRYEF